MGFFARLKWLFLGTGEAPAGFKQGDARSSAGHDPRRQHGRDRSPRDGRDNRGNRGEGRGDGRGDGREPRGQFNREGRDGRGNREGREGRGGRDGFRNERGERGERSERGERNDRGDRSRRSGQGRRENNDFARPIERPAGGPSSTMMPAISSVQAAPAAAPAAPLPQGPEKIGSILQYDEQARTAIIQIDKCFVRSGDWIEIQGHVSSLRQKVDSLQIEGQIVPEAREGQKASIRVIRPVRPGDSIARLRG